ncbi:TPA: conjugal transfer protein TraR [Escherichia coli]
MSDEADEAYSVTEQLTMTGINRIRQKINVHGIPVYLCEACGNPIPEARRKIFPGVTLCVECQGNDSNLLIVFYVQIMPDDFVMQLHRF